MQDKADAIRELLDLPDTDENKMYPSEMADKILEGFEDDPGLIFKLNDWPMVSLTGTMDQAVQSFRYAGLLFDSRVTNLDFTLYHTVKFDFVISDTSITFTDVLDESTLSSRYRSDTWDACPIRSLLYLNTYKNPDGQYSYSHRQQHTTLGIYKTQSEGIVICIFQMQQGTNRYPTVIKKLTHMENKKLSVIYDILDPSKYLVYVDNVLDSTVVLSDDTDWLADNYVTGFMIGEGGTQIGLGTYMDWEDGVVVSGITRHSVGDGWDSYQDRWPNRFNRTFDIKYDKIEVSYIK